MSSKYFRIDEHRCPSQHIREYPRSTANSQEEQLQLAIKQYSPSDNPRPQPGDVTIIACHAAGCFKELYEPFFDELYLASKRDPSGYSIRSIWIADIVTHGESSILNEGKLGIDYSWNDHARDLLHIVNTFRSNMPMPIVGLGHSMGATNIVQLSLLHPRLFATLVCVEPILHASHRGKSFEVAVGIVEQRDVWPSRQDALAAVRKKGVQRSWDPRVLEAWTKYGLRDLPTLLYPVENSDATTDSNSVPVTLTTTKHHDASAFARGSFPAPGQPLKAFEPTLASHPDLMNCAAKDYPDTVLYRPEAKRVHEQLPFVRPSCFYLYAEKTRFASNNTVQGRADKLNTTGIGPGGSGGKDKQAVQEIILPGGGHFIVFEKPKLVAEQANGWIVREVKKWKEEAAKEFESYSKLSLRERTMLGEDWRWWVKEWYQRPTKGKKGASHIKSAATKL